MLRRKECAGRLIAASSGVIAASVMSRGWPVFVCVCLKEGERERLCACAYILCSHRIGRSPGAGGHSFHRNP